jgi:hypothetical protein
LGFLLGVGVAVSRAVAGAVWCGGWRLCLFGSGECPGRGEGGVWVRRRVRWVNALRHVFLGSGFVFCDWCVSDARCELF